MSIDSALYLTLHPQNYRASDILECYISSGLQIYDTVGRVHLVTSDDFDWDCLTADINEIKEFLNRQREKNLPAIITLFENEEPISDLMIFHDRICLSCDVNRQVIRSVGGTEFTDVNFYMQKFIPPLETGGYTVTVLKFEEIRY
ncbi:MAG: hypothetical protein K2K57_00610 [Oscillospiraceae bacterium]|nr:hypothetical protein [Oscillospiraceae bacterium]